MRFNVPKSLPNGNSAFLAHVFFGLTVGIVAVLLAFPVVLCPSTREDLKRSFIFTEPSDSEQPYCISYNAPTPAKRKKYDEQALHFTPTAFDSFEIEKGLENVLLEELLDIPHEEFVTGGGSGDEKVMDIDLLLDFDSSLLSDCSLPIEINESYDPLEETIHVNNEIFEFDSSLTETVSFDQFNAASPNAPSTPIDQSLSFEALNLPSDVLMLDSAPTSCSLGELLVLNQNGKLSDDSTNSIDTLNCDGSPDSVDFQYFDSSLDSIYFHLTNSIDSHPTPPATFLTYATGSQHSPLNPDVNFSWSQNELPKKQFKAIFPFIGFPHALHFVTDTIDDIFKFMYSCGTINILAIKDKGFKFNEVKDEIITCIKEIFQILRSVPPDSIYYYSFEKNREGKGKINVTERIPFFFLFTTISYLIRNDKKQLDSILLQITFQTASSKIFSQKTFTQNQWQFMQEYTGPSKGAFIRPNLQFDEATISFICQEMNSTNPKLNEFFTNVWNGCNISNIAKSVVSIIEDTQFLIPTIKESKLGAFERAARKFYQIEFKKLIIEWEWETVQQLLSRFSMLKKKFSLVAVDFRCCLLNRNDFEKLHTKLIKILNLLNHSDCKINLIVAFDFFTELEYFIHFKGLLFSYDFLTEFKCDNLVDFDYNFTREFRYEATFKMIIDLLNLLGGLRYTLKNHYKLILKPLSFEAIKQDSEDELIPLKLIVGDILKFVIKPFGNDKITEYSVCNWNEIFQQHSYAKSPVRDRVLVEKVIEQVANYHYFEPYLGYLSIRATRFECNEFIAKLSDIILRKKGRINDAFVDKKWSKFRDIWKCIPFDYSTASFEVKKEFLARFQVFLIHYSQ